MSADGLQDWERWQNPCYIAGKWSRKPALDCLKGGIASVNLLKASCRGIGFFDRFLSFSPTLALTSLESAQLSSVWTVRL